MQMPILAYSPYALWNDPIGIGNAYWIKNYWTTKIYAPNGLMGPFTPESTEKSLNSSINIFNDDQFIEGTLSKPFHFIGPALYCSVTPLLVLLMRHEQSAQACMIILQ